MPIARKLNVSFNLNLFHILSEVMVTRRSNNDDDNKRPWKVVDTTSSRYTRHPSTSNLPTSHEISQNTRSANLNELLSLKYPNVVNIIIALAELRKRLYDNCCKTMGETKGNNTLSSDAGEFFEGVEKLLEVWYTTQSGNIDDCDLRRIPRFVFSCL